MPTTYYLNATDEPVSGGSHTLEKLLASATATPTAISSTVPASGSHEWVFTSQAPGVQSDTTGTYSVEVNITTADMNITYDVWARRVDSNGFHQQSFRIVQGASGGSTGVFTHSLSSQLGAFSSTERFQIQIIVRNGHAMNSVTWGITVGGADSEVIAPWTPGLKATVNQVTETDTAQILTSTTSSAYRDAVLGESSLVSYWRLDETSGTVADDRKGSNNGTYNGTTAAAGGLISDSNGARDFDNVDDFVAVPDHNSLDLTSAVTLEALIYLDAVPTQGIQDAIVAKRNAYRLYVDGGKLTFGGTRLTLSNDTTGTTSLAAGQWYHVAGTWDGSHQRVYINGALDAEQAFSTALDASTNRLLIGALSNSLDDGATWFFNGRIDEVAVYSTALSTATIRSHSNKALGLKRILGQPTETGTAQAITPTKTVTVNQVTETDTAQAITAVGPKVIAVNQVTETDTAQASTSKKTAAIGQVAETDTSQGLSAAKVKTIGQNIETDTSQAVTVTKTVAIGQAVETSSAQAVAATKQRLVGQTTEADTAQAVGSAKVKAVGQTTETDTAQTVSPNLTKIVAVGQAVETSSAQSISAAKTKVVSQITETDTAQLVTVNPQRRLVGQVTETDQAQAVSVNPKHRLVGQAAENDSALSITAVKGADVVVVAQVTENDSAQTLTSAKAKAIGQPAETGTAQAITPVKTVAIGQVAETDQAQAIGALKVKVISQITQTDTAQAITVRKARAVAQVTETDSAQVITPQAPKTAVIQTATETDTALTISAITGNDGSDVIPPLTATLGSSASTATVPDHTAVAADLPTGETSTSVDAVSATVVESSVVTAVASLATGTSTATVPDHTATAEVDEVTTSVTDIIES